MDKVRVRFAPSPTGNLHVGGARTALFNWLFARHNKGTFILRIEDTDAERSKDVFTKAILDGLRWLGMDWDEGPEAGGDCGPYFQTQRMDLYRSAIRSLLDQGKLYHCFCTTERLEKLREEQAAAKLPIRYDGKCRTCSREEVESRVKAGERHVLRLRLPEGEAVAWDDITKGPLSFSSDLLDDLVVMKSDGFPTYNFAVVIDDVGMRITHVIRGEDHISNTPKQILIYRALGKPLPRFAHIPMILGSDRTRLSKRHGATSVIEYQKLGFDPRAFRNYLALLGWSPESGREIMMKEELVSAFDLGRVSSHGAIFDIEKLRWMNMEYIKALHPNDLLTGVTPWFEAMPGFPGGYDPMGLRDIAWLYRERLRTFDEIAQQAEWFFREPAEFEPKGMEKASKIEDWPKLVSDLTDNLAGMADFSEGPLEAAIRGFATQRQRKAGDVIFLCRLAISGRTATPGLFESMRVLGKDRCLSRLRTFVSARQPKG